MVGDKRWVRMIAEGAAILTSILLAFGIQAWWEGRGEGHRREAILLGLASDFAISDTLLTASMRFDSIRADALGRLVVLARQPTVPAALQATVDTLLSKSYFGTRYEPASGTLDALINAGDLDLLADPSLASALTSWVAVVDRLRYRQVAVTDLTLQDLDPYLRTRVRTGDLIWTDFEHPYSPPWNAEHTDAYLFLSDLELQGILSNLWFLSVQTIDLSRQVQDHLDRVRSALESELVGSGLD